MSVSARREREREKRRGRILDAAQRVFWEHGFDCAKMEDIADAAQLGKGTLYLYFRTKDDLALGLAMRHQRAMIGRFEALQASASTGLELVRSLLLAYAEHMCTPVEHLRLAMGRWIAQEPFDPDTKGGAQARANVVRLMGIVREAVARAQAEGAVRDDMSPARLAMFAWSNVNGALLLELKLARVGRGSPIAEHVPSVEEHVDWLLDSIRPGRERRPSGDRHSVPTDREAS